MATARTRIGQAAVFLIGLAALALALSVYLSFVGVILAVAALLLSGRRRWRGWWLVAVSPSLVALLFVAVVFLTSR